ncbi:glycine zipper 2TM domain-containing protein [Phenylobacterium sp.]|uniref:glycine zipper 2TM domain-containing protein n=1 Tax=Phenylobacterium sp. TaxID=1871053 RepID=UPI002811F8B9|nr:glycine zipper 2TM domain-containing protein [Phenylobacterium sp.]
MNALLKIGTASALALATAAPAYAQYYRPTDEYQRQYQDYQAQRERYQDSREDYREARRDYAQARRDYERRLAEWERERIRYDARYGYGAYERRYARPVWDDAYWANNRAPDAGYYGSNASTNIRCNNNSTVTAGVLGAIVGGVLGSNVAARNARTEGAVLGALVGGGIGAAVGNANDRYKCDSRGPYFTYNDTVPYRESRSYRYGSYDTSYYTRQRCRLAPAPVDTVGNEYRYVRVCPDDTGRYRITG